MSLFAIARAYVWNRRWVTLLTVISILLGMSLISVVITIRNETEAAFAQQGTRSQCHPQRRAAVAHVEDVVGHLELSAGAADGPDVFGDIDPCPQGAVDPHDRIGVLRRQRRLDAAGAVGQGRHHDGPDGVRLRTRDRHVAAKRRRTTVKSGVHGIPPVAY